MKSNWIDYDKVHCQLDWNEVKDTTWVYDGDEWSGTLIILDKDDEIIKVIGYEKINDVDREQ